MVEPDVGIQHVDAGFQVGVFGQRLVGGVLQFAIVARAGLVARRAGVVPHQRDQRRAADHHQRERAAQNAQPAELDLYVGFGRVVEHLGPQHDQQHRRKAHDGQQVKIRHKLLRQQQNTGGDQQQRKGDGAHAAHLFGAGRGGFGGVGGRSLVFLHFVYLTVFYTNCIIGRARTLGGAARAIWRAVSPAGRGAGCCRRPCAAGAGPAARCRRR